MTDETRAPLPETGLMGKPHTALMREHADYMASYNEHFVGSTDAIARALRTGADRIDQLERELTEKESQIKMQAANHAIVLTALESARSATRTSGRTVRDAGETAEDFSGPPAIVSTTQPSEPVAWMWEYVGNDPYAKKHSPVARGVEEMDPKNPPYPDTWRPLYPLVRSATGMSSK